MSREPKPSGNIVKRKINNRKQNKLVLIVCEDEKSGCDYLKIMVKALRLHAVCIVQSSATGSAPISVVEDAIKRRDQQAKEKKDRFEIIYCVYDIDEHKSINDARQLASSEKFEVIESNPCFEFWLLLHFTPYSAPIVRKGQKSPADVCVSELKKHKPSYDKSKIENIFADLFHNKLNDAINNAKKLHNDAQKTNTRNPSTGLWHF